MSRTVAIVTRAWFPNHQQLFEMLADKLGSAEIELRYGTMMGAERGRQWQGIARPARLIPEQLGRGPSLKIGDKEIAPIFGIRRWIRSINPSCIVVSPASEIGNFVACNEGRRLGIPVIGWMVGKREGSDGAIDGFRRSISHLLHRKFCERLDYAFCYGTKSVQDILSLGLHKPETVFNVRHCIDDKKYVMDPFERNRRRQQFWNAHSLSAGYHFGYVGQLIRRKGTDLLIEAFENLTQKNPGSFLHIVGRGPQHTLATDAAARFPGRIRIYDTLSADGLLNFFSGMDCMVVPSRFDDWSTVVNEAICTLTHFIASSGVHAAFDLCSPEQIFNSHSVPALQERMRQQIAASKPLELLIRRQSEYEATWSMESSCGIWADALKRILKA